MMNRLAGTVRFHTASSITPSSVMRSSAARRIACTVLRPLSASGNVCAVANPSNGHNQRHRDDDNWFH